MSGSAQGGTGLALDPTKAHQLARMLRELTPEQALWLSGYLAAVAGGPTAPAPDGAAASSGDDRRPWITVLYGTETGNARGVAESLVQRATEAGLRARAVDMAEYRTRRLRKETHLAVVTATHGEGDPPDGAVGFFEFLQSRKVPRLENLCFAVLSLGDSSYVEFCRAGQDVDARLEELGGRRIMNRVDCDVDFHGPAGEWIKRVVRAFRKQVPSDGEPERDAADGSEPLGILELSLALRKPPPSGIAPAGAVDEAPSARRVPVRAELLDRVPLTGLHSDKETLHVELSLEGSGIDFRPGDSLGVVARNESPVVDAILEAIRAEPSAPVRIGDAEMALGDALKEELELTLVTPAFLRSWAELADSDELSALGEDGDRSALHRFLQCHQVRDVLEAYPVPGLEPQKLVSALRKLQPRLYSIASSPRWTPDQVDLTVAVTRRTPDGKTRNGVTSTYLADRREPGDEVEAFLERNDSFRLPTDPDVPLVMIGAGTGVAPFRAFLQDREETGARGATWLFFGERRFREDFLYQTEWQRFLRDGVLTRMDVAFSRDQREKVYVQDRLRERAPEVLEWLEDGAYLYVCGDARGMAPGVDAALREILVDPGGRTLADAGDELRRMRAEGRYRRDVY